MIDLKPGDRAAPTSGLCNAGTATAVTGSGPWRWSCQGVEGGADAACSAAREGTLNDTGIDWCADADTNRLDCPLAGYPGQDGDNGRDVTDIDANDGRAGFSFTKLDAAGNDLPADATDWTCVRDNVTGALWEVHPGVWLAFRFSWLFQA